MKEFDIRKMFSARKPAAQQALERFRSRYQSYLEINSTVALNILVWGPSLRSTSRVANKRQEIYRELLRQGHNAMFSEELVMDTADSTEERSNLKRDERAQARAADYIIVLLGEDATGALGEIHDFSGDIAIAWKLFVLAPESYQQSYAGHGTLGILKELFNGVYWYADSEIESCSVLTEALIRVDTVRELYAYSPSRGFGGIE